MIAAKAQSFEPASDRKGIWPIIISTIPTALFCVSGFVFDIGPKSVRQSQGNVVVSFFIGEEKEAR